MASTKRLRRRWWAVSAALVVIAARGASGSGGLFDYRSSDPFDLRVVRSEVQPGGVEAREITYASPKGGRVPAHLVVPPGTGPFAGIVMVHGGGESACTFLPEALELAGAGAVLLLPEAPANRPATDDDVVIEDDSLSYVPNPEQSLHFAVDIRRGVDLLASLPNVDAARIGYVGHSSGAMLGADLVAADKRFKSAILIAGAIGFTDQARTSPNPLWERWRRTTSHEVQRRYLEAIAPFDPRHFLGHTAPARLLFQAGRADAWVAEADTRAFFAAAQEPKELKWYDADHDLRIPAAASDRRQWLRDVLHLTEASRSVKQ